MKLLTVLSNPEREKKLYIIDADAKIRAAALKMIESGMGCLMVREPGSEPVKFIGLVTKSDLLKAFCEGNPDRAEVREFMTKHMIVASAIDDVNYVMNIMTRHKISYLPVIDGKSIAGVISMDDILSALNVEKDIELHWASDMTGAAPALTVY